MNELTAKIAKQSKIILILAEVARIILYVMIGLDLTALVGSYLNLPDPLFTLFGCPVRLMELTGGETLSQARINMVEELIQIALALKLLFMTSALFERIQASETPFTLDIVKKMKAMAIMLGVVVAVDNGYLGVVIAFVVYAFAMIFEYGGELQKQVDETL